MTRKMHIQVRVSEEEKGAIQGLASQAGLDVSTFMRQSALGFRVTLKRELLEAGAASSGSQGAADARQAVDERREVARQFVANDGPQRYRCPRDCDSGWRPASPTPRCPSCRRVTVPA